MGRDRTSNGMGRGWQYREQQKCIENVAAELGCVVFRPDYHGTARDGNTVLLYFPEDHEHNLKVDREPTHYGSKDEAKMYGCFDERYYYRPYFWSFCNDDANGRLTYDFANHGRLDLRGLHAEEVIAGSIRLAYYTKLQNFYTAGCGGLGGVSEADSYYNDLNRKRIDAFREAYGKCYLGSINAWNPGDPILREYTGGTVKNFACDFIVNREDEKLLSMIRDWRDGKELPKKWGDADGITSRVREIGGELTIWY